MTNISPITEISVKTDGPVARIVLNRPEKNNAINDAMWRALPKIAKTLGHSDEVRVIVITGAGNKAFSAGADISQFTENRSGAEQARAYERLNVEAFSAIEAISKPTIAQISGFCMGGGLALALSCDLRIADDTAVFSLPPAKLGLAYPVQAIRRLLTGISAPFAKEMIYTARRVNALDAYRAGLVNQVIPADQLADTVAEVTATIAANAPLTLAASKATIDEMLLNPQNPDMQKLTRASDKCFTSKDYLEGIAAFTQKRRPKFTGN